MLQLFYPLGKKPPILSEKRLNGPKSGPEYYRANKYLALIRNDNQAFKYPVHCYTNCAILTVHNFTNINTAV
jgi:hypothetical protein